MRASGEYKLRMELTELVDIWKKIDFTTKTYKERDGVFILTDLDTIYNSLDEGQAKVNMILGNRYVKVMRVDAESMKKQLAMLSEAVDQWKMVQSAWMYLENIFQSGDIKKTLGKEAQLFEQVDKFFRNLMVKTNKNPNSLRALKITPNLIDNLKQQNDHLDAITKALQDYMEVKRVAFPRFYFLSDDELLEILANSDNKDIIQLHLKTLFDNLVRLDIQEVEIKAMYSRETECVEFVRPQKARGNVEAWLLAVQEEMKATVQRKMKEGLKDYSEPGRKDWVTKHPGQVVATIAQVQWCTGTEDAINEMPNDRLALGTWLD